MFIMNDDRNIPGEHANSSSGRDVWPRSLQEKSHGIRVYSERFRPPFFAVQGRPFSFSESPLSARGTTN